MNSKPIPYAHIVLDNYKLGTSTNEAGHFILNTLGITEDTLIISSIGYRKKLIPFNMEFDTLKIKIILDVSINELEEVVIIPNDSKKRYHSTDLGFYNSKDGNGLFTTIPGDVVVVYIKNPYSIAGRLKQVKLKLSNNSRVSRESKIKLRILARNKYRLSPEIDILTKNIIIDPGKKNLKIDVEEQNITFPLEGLFVGVEWMDSNEKNQNNELVNPSLRWAFNHNQKQTFFSYRNKKWIQDYSFNLQDKKGNAMIGVEVEFEKNRKAHNMVYSK